jgi:hypothetical protein
MDAQEIYHEYSELYQDLAKIVEACEIRVLEENSDPFFISNYNYLVKSFLVNICAYLEAYTRDLVFQKIQEYNSEIIKAKVPHNLVRWSIQNRDLKDNDLKFENFQISVSKRSLDQYISGNPSKTARLFGWIGFKLDEDDDFNKKLEIIENLVSKRNAILHHKDSAGDVSIADVLAYIREVQEYILILYNVLYKDY